MVLGGESRLQSRECVSVCLCVCHYHHTVTQAHTRITGAAMSGVGLDEEIAYSTLSILLLIG